MVYINCVVFVTYKHLCFLPANLLYYYFIVISRENTLMILASKCRIVQTCQKWCNYTHVHKNQSKSCEGFK